MTIQQLPDTYHESQARRAYEYKDTVSTFLRIAPRGIRTIIIEWADRKDTLSDETLGYLHRHKIIDRRDTGGWVLTAKGRNASNQLHNKFRGNL